MPPTEKRPAADAFLCESCGYDLAGLGEEGACPECGTALAESHPKKRAGSPAQRARGLTALWRTNIGVLRSRAVWDGVSLGSNRTSVLLAHNLAVGALIAGFSIYVPGPLSRASYDRGGYWMIFAACFFALTLLLTWFESLGVRFFGHQRRWRVTKHVASAVCAHASVGWIIAALLLGIGWHVGQRLSLDPLFIIPAPIGGGIPITWPVLLPIAGFFVGLLVFESLVYIGVRRLRFANHAGVVIR